MKLVTIARRSLVDFQKSLLNKCMQIEKAELENNGRLLSIELSELLEQYIGLESADFPLNGSYILPLSDVWALNESRNNRMRAHVTR
jgi:hypothetical protein